MAIPTQRDPAATAAAAHRGLADLLPAGAQPELANLVVPQSTGHSNETLLLDATWRGADPAVPDERRTVALVARIRPTGYAVFPEYDMSLQYRCMEIIDRVCDVPVPRVRWLEERPEVLGPAVLRDGPGRRARPRRRPAVLGRGLAEGGVPSPTRPACGVRRTRRAGAPARPRLAGGRLRLPGRAAGAAAGDFDAQLAFQRRYLEWMAKGAPAADARRRRSTGSRPTAPAVGGCDRPQLG